MTPAPRRCLLLVAVAVAFPGMGGCGRDAPPSPAPLHAEKSPDAAARKDARKSAPTGERSWALQVPALAKAEVVAAQKQADAALAAGNLERGVGAAPGALELNLAVLAVDPGNAAAHAGLERTLDALFERGRIAMRRGQLVEAERIGQIAARVFRQHRDLGDYGQRLARARAADAMVRAGVARAAAGRFETSDTKNAAAAFRRALALLPGYEPAVRERDTAQAARLEAAWAAAGAGHFDIAAQRLDEAVAFRADAPAVLAMRLRIAEAREARTQAALAAGRRAVHTLALEQADAQLRAAEAVAAQPAGVEALRESIFLARHYGHFAPGRTFAEPLADGGTGPELVVVPFGRFEMGDDDDARPHEGPIRTVVFARGFAMGRAEITVAEFRRFVEATGYRSRATREGRSNVFDERGGSVTEHEGVDWRRDFLGRVAAEDRPVTHVAFEDAQAYAEWLTKQTGARYRLATEAEWEYALRGGERHAYPWGEGTPPPKGAGNLSGEGDKSSHGRSWGTPIRGYTDFFWGTAPVRSFPAERYGTFDLVGNVSEWVLDCWHDGYRRAPVDGTAWVNPGCTQRVVRGASWASALDQARSAARMAADAKTTQPWLGFRVVREI